MSEKEKAYRDRYALGIAAVVRERGRIARDLGLVVVVDGEEHDPVEYFDKKAEDIETEVGFKNPSKSDWLVWPST